MGQSSGNGQVMHHSHNPGPFRCHLVGNADNNSLVGQVQVGCGLVQKQPISPTQGLPRPELSQDAGNWTRCCPTAR